MSIEENKMALIRFYDEAIGKGNPAIIDELLAPDFVHHGDALFPLIEGSEAIKQGVMGVKNAFPDGYTIIEDMVAEGDTVVCRLSWRGTHKGEFMGVAPTGKQMSWAGISTYRFANGKIVERWANQDVVGMLQEMGLVPSLGMDEDNKSIIQRYVEEVINKRTLVPIAEFVNTDCVDHAAPPGWSNGIEGVKQFLGMFFTAFPDMHYAVDDMLAEGDKVVVSAVITGTHKGEFQGLPPTGKPFSVTCIEILRLSGGKISEHWGGIDNLSLMQQLGMMGQPAAAR